MKHAGFTLIELMLCLAMVSSIVVSITEVYLNASRNFQKQQAVLENEDHLRVAEQFLKSDVSSAGYFGCVSNAPFQAIQGFSLDSPNLPEKLRKKVKAGTDVIEIQKMIPGSAFLLKSVDKASTLLAKPDSHFKVSDRLMISNCHHAEIIKISSIHVNKNQEQLGLMKPLDSSFDVRSKLGVYEDNTYYVSKTDRGIDALYLLNADGERYELVEGIDDLAFHYFENHQWLSSDQVHSWQDVLGVQVDVTSQSTINPHLKQARRFLVALRQRRL